MTHGTDVPAGWYRDPLGAPQLRWWNAAAWTEHVSELANPSTPPSDTSAQQEREVTTPTLVNDREPLIIHPAPRVRASDHAAAAARRGSTTALVPDRESEQHTPEPQQDAEPAPRRERQRTSSPEAAFSLTADTWNALNRAITEAVHSPAEPLVELRFIDAPTLVIDPRGQLYWWADSIDNLASTSSDSDVETVPRPLGIHHNEAGRDWEPLVWLVGTQAEPESFDPLSLSGARFKLRRWPNLTTLKHTTDQMTMTAMLGAAYLTVTELASLAKVETDDARRLVSTFELMGLLTHTVDTTADAARDPFSAPQAKEGIFSRLKARFSR
ncbi:DUF2510 domain-containing protein [Salinibacterium sp. M195]|uniref:DUF2510 domain-containing protein n=1 Tax=Salinibacterium sp. M195 TaxID=2583374 RepID=UPI001C62D428|nr:DUF2510 domain-containing protein [Salinibacterium sp. M195]QYH34811.1 DUF2510 domain-containing protein [Salinibacterium sp. M195]